MGVNFLIFKNRAPVTPSKSSSRSNLRADAAVSTAYLLSFRYDSLYQKNGIARLTKTSEILARGSSLGDLSALAAAAFQYAGGPYEVP
jgi:hypothetical protein